MFLLQLPQARHEPRAHGSGVLLQPLIIDDVQHLLADAAREGRAAKGREELRPLGKAVRNGAGGDQHAKGVPVADGFAHHHDIRQRALVFEAEVIVAKAPQPGLHLIGNADTACGTDLFIDRWQVPLGRDDLTADGREGFRDEARQPMTLVFQALNGRVHQIREFLRPIRVIAFEAAAIIIGDLDQLDPVRRADPSGCVELVGRDINRPGGIAVIAVIGRHHSLGAGMSAGQPQGQLVRLGAGVDEEADLKRIG